jgi:transcriptional regulator with XRE-family HTH domain
MNRVIERCEERLLGLPYPVTLLDSAEEIADPDTGEALGVAVPKSEELAAAVALALCFQPFQLTGPEVRFVRRVLNMTGQELAAAIEMDPATLSRWEHGKQSVGEWADKALRMAAVLLLQDNAPGSSLHPADLVGLRIRRRPEGWQPRIEARRVRLFEDSELGNWDALAA